MDSMYEQIDLLHLIKKPFKIKKPIRLIELFAGIGSQAMALKMLGSDFEHYKVIEFDKFAIKSYNEIHGTCFDPTDITRIRGSDLGIVDTETFTYLLTLFLVKIYRLPVNKREWLKVAAPGPDYCGK